MTWWVLKQSKRPALEGSSVCLSRVRATGTGSRVGHRRDAKEGLSDSGLKRRPPKREEAATHS